MNRFLRPLLLCFLTVSGCLAQSFFRIDSLPPQGILLDKGWKFHAGDNPEWAKTDFNDRQWEAIDPTMDIYELTQVQKVNLGWFRLSMQIDSSLFQKIIGLRVQQMGASEIYLNGKAIFRFGKVSTNFNEIKTYNPSGDIIAPTKLIFTQLEQHDRQTLAVRYALQPNVFYNLFDGRPNSTLKIEMSEANQADANPLRQPFSFNIAYTDYFKFSIFLFLCGLHFAFYRLYPKRKNNLFISLYALLSALFYLVHSLSYEYIHDVEIRMKLYILFDLNFILLNLFILTGVYFLFQQQRGYIYYGIIGYSIIGFPFILFDYYCGDIYVFVTIQLVSIIDALRVTWIAWKRKKDGAVIILIGAASTILFLGLGYLAIYFTLQTPFWIMSQHILINLALLSMPTAISLFLSKEFATNSNSLELQLIEIQHLSAKTIAQEQERQQILAIQNETLEKQVSVRTTELNHSLTELKATQSQLIQKEKMASLGELTAGIAHEIQNPLNFVNNFSELSTELVGELREEQQKPDRDQKLEGELLGDLQQNLQKITLHGQRASSIVKGMLEHSRSSTGKRKLTNLNALTDEYLRLAYHGLRRSGDPAKDTDGGTGRFNPKVETHFDSSLGEIGVVPQDIGRVLLNLFNNAFYAVQERQKQQDDAYVPTVTVSTHQQHGQVEIRVQDNGTGIPKELVNKIYQPFFTIKPTGQGTGLGLSLAYDIITKGHGGKLTVESAECGNTEFVISLPIR